MDHNIFFKKDYCKNFTVEKKNLKKNLSFKFAQRSNLVDGIYIYRPRSKFISEPGNISQVFFRPSQPRPRIVFKFFPQYLPISTLPTFLVSTFLISSLPPSPSRQLARRFIFVSRIVKKEKKVHEKVSGSRPANIVHSNLFPLYFPPLFLPILSFDLLVLIIKRKYISK